ncbi:hypothetical protein VTI74DRAFT_1045 [Chaetomium olivicolor]
MLWRPATEYPSQGGDVEVVPEMLALLASGLSFNSGTSSPTTMIPFLLMGLRWHGAAHWAFLSCSFGVGSPVENLGRLWAHHHPFGQAF